MWNLGFRDRLWGDLDRHWDIVVVGGGITGAGIFAEAARLGLSVLLVDANDFASGTSSRSTKLVHGGLRYLRQAQVRVTRESVRERERLLREASGLVKPLGFYLTTFERDQMPGWMMGAGLAVYDLIAGKWAHKQYSAAQLSEAIPELAGASLRGGFHYFDAQTDDARLVIRVLREGERRGGQCINYVEAADLLRNRAGYVCGVVLRDRASNDGRTIEVSARAVVNATGTWSDVLRAKVGGERRLRPIRGSHLTFPWKRVPLPAAISLMHPRDSRAVFAIPWEGATIIGTTDVDHKDGLNVEPATSQWEAEYILESAQHAFPSLEITASDIVASWSGVRSVIDTGATNPSKESRDHALWNENGLLTVTGGKLTTFRIMALDALAELRHMLADLKPPGRRGQIFPTTLPDELRAMTTLDDSSISRLLGRFGSEAKDVAALGELDRIDPTPTLWAEVAHAARNEGIVHLDDLLLRRVRLGLLLPQGGMLHVARIRALSQGALGWDNARWASEEARYRTIWARSYGTTFSAS